MTAVTAEQGMSAAVVIRLTATLSKTIMAANGSKLWSALQLASAACMLIHLTDVDLWKVPISQLVLMGGGVHEPGHCQFWPLTCGQWCHNSLVTQQSCQGHRVQVQLQASVGPAAFHQLLCVNLKCCVF